jgi:opacity protein-like surface antigen
MKLSESCAVVCALVASLGSAGASGADDFRALYIRADVGGSMRGTTLIKEQKLLAPDKPTEKQMEFNSHAHSDAATTSVLSSTGDVARVGVSPSVATPRVRPTAVTRRGQAGHDFRAGSVVVGVELDVETLKLYDGKSTTATYSCCAATCLLFNDAVKTDWFLTGRPRFGFVSGHWLVYSTGGMALTNRFYDAEVTDAVATARGNDGIKEIRTGWTAGGGVEYKRARLALRGEYLYYGSFAGMSATGVSVTAIAPPAFPSSLVTQTANLKPQIVRAALSFRF